MIIVDTHCHIGIRKYEPVESLLFHMQQAKVENAVLIQYSGNIDNTYMVECMAAHPGRFKAAMIVEKSDDGTRIEEWAEKGIVGIRLPAGSRAECSDPLAQWRTAENLGLIVSIQSTPASLLSNDFAKIIETFPDLQLVIEHLGGLGQFNRNQQKNTESPYQEFEKILELARHPNLTIKLPGFGEFCPVPLPFNSIPPLVDKTLEAFGPQRIMWGSDYPPVSQREGYNNSLKIPMNYLSSLSKNEKEWIFGRTALKTWSFEKS